jgi:thiamine pyrophosphokinase
LGAISRFFILVCLEFLDEGGVAEDGYVTLIKCIGKALTVRFDKELCIGAIYHLYAFDILAVGHFGIAHSQHFLAVIVIFTTEEINVAFKLTLIANAVDFRVFTKDGTYLLE